MPANAMKSIPASPIVRGGGGKFSAAPEGLGGLVGDVGAGDPDVAQEIVVEAAEQVTLTGALLPAENPVDEALGEGRRLRGGEGNGQNPAHDVLHRAAAWREVRETSSRGLRPKRGAAFELSPKKAGAKRSFLI